jgi:hypothetical protein
MTAREFIERAIERRAEGKDIIAALGVSDEADRDAWFLAVKAFVMHLPDRPPQEISDFTDAESDSALASALQDLS